MQDSEILIHKHTCIMHNIPFSFKGDFKLMAVKFIFSDKIEKCQQFFSLKGLHRKVFTLVF